MHPDRPERHYQKEREKSPQSQLCVAEGTMAAAIIIV